MANRSREKKVEVSLHDLRALLFWSAVGIAKSNGGSYGEAADSEIGNPGIVRRLAKDIKFKLPFAPRF